MVVDDRQAGEIPARRVSEGLHTPDVDAVAFAQWRKRDFPIRSPGSRNLVQLVVRRSVLNAVREHGLSRSDVEVCGVLVGECCQDERGPFIYLEAAIRGNHSDSKTAQVTFTAETWTHIHNEIDRHYEDKRILGWYHTHPGFGIFLSGMDLFIQESFFNASEQVAYVFDPIGGDDGLFVWRAGKAERGQYLIEEDEPEPTSGGSDSTKAAMTAGAEMPSGASERLERLERRQQNVIVAVALVAAIAIAWPVLAARFVSLAAPATPIDRTSSDDRDSRSSPATREIDSKKDRKLPKSDPESEPSNAP